MEQSSRGAESKSETESVAERGNSPDRCAIRSREGKRERDGEGERKGTGFGRYFGRRGWVKDDHEHKIKRWKVIILL